MAIPQEFIDELLDRVDIVELIGQRVALRNRGRRYVACCPFHNEKTPSFTVDAQKQFYYCFGCRASGTAINFLMRKDGIDFVSAVRQLAAQQGMEVPDSYRGDSATQRRFRHLADILDAAAQFYRQCLKENRKASQYVEQRRIDQETAGEMRVGYAPGDWDALIRHFDGRYPAGDLLSVGLIKSSAKKADRHYDVFRDRLMFPIRNMRGQTVGFGGRALGEDEPAKYLNTPATDLFRKKSEIYGLFEARQSRDRSADDGNLFLVEGYMDVIAMKCHGLHNAVACMGTAVNRVQLQRLLNKSRRLILCFDSDAAGVEAAWRAVAEGLYALDDEDQMQVLLLPKGEDPDSWLRQHGAAGWRAYLSENTIELDEFLFRRLGEGRDFTLLSERLNYARQVVSLCRTLRSPLYRQLLQDALAERAGLGASTLTDLISQGSGAARSGAGRGVSPRPRSARISHTKWDDLLGLLLAWPGLIAGIEADEHLLYLDDFRNQVQENCPNGCLRTLIDCSRRFHPAGGRQLLSALGAMAEENDTSARDDQKMARIKRLQEIAMSPDAQVSLGIGSDNEEGFEAGTPGAEVTDAFVRLCNSLRKDASKRQLKKRLSRLARDLSLDELDPDAERELRATYKTSSKPQTAGGAGEATGEDGAAKPETADQNV